MQGHAQLIAREGNGFGTPNELSANQHTAYLLRSAYSAVFKRHFSDGSK